MIRRNFTLDNGTTTWLLLSQVEHARISGELTCAWHKPFSHEVVEAITHHDDGWAKWEATPQLDAVRGRPLSFLELAFANAIEIWNDSIASAHRFGPLAGAIVAGHFIGLASGSDHAQLPPAKQWLVEMRSQRTGWLEQWRHASTDHTQEIADRAQQMLLTADLLSLWLCLDGPLKSEGAAATLNNELNSRSTNVLGQYRFLPATVSVFPAGIDWCGSLLPWPCSMEELNLHSPALAVPVAHYHCWADIAAAGSQVDLHWRLRKTLPAGDEC